MPRLLGVEIPAKKKVAYSLRYIYGVGPARADAWIVRQGRSNFVLQVEVTDVGRDNKLAAVSTIAFTVLAPR